MKKQVLDVGQCGYDHQMIKVVLHNLGAEVTQVHSSEEALQSLEKKKYDLVLVNRLFDRDRTPGIPLIEKILNKEKLKDINIALVSNYTDAQAEATALGAKKGFGKADLHSTETRDLLTTYLEG